MWDLFGSTVAGTGDFNGDGLDDVLLHASNGTFVAYLAQQGGGFANSGHTANPGSGWSIVGTGDFNGDGRDDVLLQQTNGQFISWLGQANGAFLSSGHPLSTGVSWWRAATIGDFNGDGRDDIFAGNPLGSHADWLGQTNGGFTSSGATFATRGTSSDHWSVKGGGDFNGDGRSDVLWENTATGALEIWQGTANGGVAAAFSTTIDLGLTIVATGDVDNDGRADVLLADGSGHLSYMAGTTTGLASPLNVASEKGTGWHIAGIADFDADGRDDFLWANSTSFDTQLNAADDIIPPTPEELWAQALAEVQAFFDELGSETERYVQDAGRDQGSYYDDGDFWLQLSENESFLDAFGEPNSSGGSFADQLTSDGWILDMAGYTASLTTGDYTLNLLNPADNSFLFDLDGTLLVGQLHQGDPPAADPNAIVITGQASSSPPIYFTFDAMANVINYSGVHVSGGGSTVYSTVGASSGANAFADTHVKKIGTTVADEHAYELVHDAFAKFYDWVLQNPAAQIYLGKTGTFDMYVSATKALLDLQNVTYNIADTGGGLTGDSTFVQYDSSATFPQFATSTLNPGVWFSYAGNQGNGDIGLNYTILHEIGHSLLAFEFGMSAQADEMAANTAGRSIETALGMTLLTVTPGGFYTP